LDEPNPEIDKALGIRSDDLGLDDGTEHKKSRKLNTVVRRQLQTLPVFTPMDIERAMRADNLTTVGDFVQADAPILKVAAGVTQQQSESLVELFRCDFRLTPA
jgi:hypothetical protein